MNFTNLKYWTCLIWFCVVLINPYELARWFTIICYHSLWNSFPFVLITDEFWWTCCRIIWHSDWVPWQSFSPWWTVPLKWTLTQNSTIISYDVLKPLYFHFIIDNLILNKDKKYWYALRYKDFTSWISRRYIFRWGTHYTKM